MEKRILGIGNALVDILIQTENDTILDQLQLPKGSMQLVDSKSSEKVNEKTAHLNRTRACGGSAANTIHGLAKLGVSTGFIGHVGEDETGEFFKKDLLAAGVEPKLFSSTTLSGIAHALVSQDGERTFATHLGAAIELSEKHLTPNLFEGYDYLYVEGYLVANKPLIIKAINLAKEAGLKIVLDLASYNVVEENREFLLNLVKEKVDIVFCNEEEAKALTGKTPQETLDFLAQYTEIAIVKIGKEGSLIKKGGETIRVAAFDVKASDTTGAGDMYAAGFLYGLINGKDLHESGRIGTLLAANVIEVIGAKMDESRWKKIRAQITMP
ncbi:MAG: adenosine kinase [Lentimicrobiaceae bacterium]|jgi:sugar/nucleoside kinase (ribokinase family)|nr:adenosine kinase [Lentimicrobiaceae bacterium]